ncbi:MAG: sugar ABC transporter substrate-binding protein [Clostridiales bacterium]|mgnify:FL=1|nr:sugar ABC transporter substrate-binding protein [Clostridiales bacterium]
MKLKKIIAGTLSCLLAVTALSACGNKQDSSSQLDSKSSGGGDKTTITYYESSDGEIFSRAIVDAFNESQNEIYCDLQIIPNDDYDTKIKALLSGSDDMVDVFYLRMLSQATQFGDNGISADLKPYMEKTSLDLTKYGVMLDPVTNDDGSIYALPKTKSSWYIFYNKEIFDEANEPYPEQLTWDEYAELAKKLTIRDGDTVTQWGGYFPPWTTNLYALQQNEYLTDDDLTQTRKSAEFLNRIYNVDKSHMDIAQMNATNSNPNPEFESGNVAMMVNGDWTFTLLNADEDNGLFDFEWDMAPLPVPEGVNEGTTVGGTSYLGINEKSNKKDAAWKFMEFFANEGSIYIAENSSLPAYMTDEAANVYVEATRHESAKLVFGGDTYGEENSHPKYSEIRTAYNDTLNLYLLGEISLDDFISSLKEQREAIIDTAGN